MAKLWSMVLVCVTVCAQLALATDVKEALNNSVREQLKGYEQFLAQDDGSHKVDLRKLIELTEAVLKADALEEKQALLKAIPSNFSEDFNKYISVRLEEFQVNDDITDAIQFYNSLTSYEEHRAEIATIVGKLENMLKESDLKAKEEQFFTLNQSFSPAFAKFLKENSLPKVNQDLQNIAVFFENLLVENNLPYVAQIKELKAKAEAALAATDVDEKQSALNAITNPADVGLYEYLQMKFIERQ